MTMIRFKQTAPSGNATINTDGIVIDTSGKVWVGPPAAHGMRHASDEELAALEGHFGASWRDAVLVMKALGD